MGYTHYWKRTRDSYNATAQKNYTEALKHIKEFLCLKEVSDLIEFYDPIDTAIGPIIGPIAFNGIGDQEHESFNLPLNYSELREFNFCKTAHKDYDVVVGCLCILAKYCGNFVEVSSDGDARHWERGASLSGCPIPNTICR